MGAASSSLQLMLVFGHFPTPGCRKLFVVSLFHRILLYFSRLQNNQAHFLQNIISHIVSGILQLSHLAVMDGRRDRTSRDKYLSPFQIGF